MELNDEKSNIIVNVQSLTDEAWTLEASLNPDSLPIPPARDSVIFPMSTVPLSLGRENSLAIARAAADRNVAIGLVCQKVAADEKPTISKLYKFGVLAQVMRVIDLREAPIPR